MKKLRAVLAMVLVCGMLVLSSCSDSSTSTDGNSTNNPSEQPSQGDSPSSTTEQVLFENEKVKVSFIEIFEMPEMLNNCYLRLKVENKSDKTVTVAIKDSYVNDTAQMIGSGVPMTLAPGKNSQTPFFFGYGNLGITSKDEIQKIEFKVWLMDDDFDTVVETDSLVVEFNK